MIKEIQDGIIEKLKGITPVKTVDVYLGDIAELLKMPQAMPSLQVIYNGCGFAEKKVIGSNIAPHDMTFVIVLMNKNLRGRKECSDECYEIIESVRTALIGSQVNSYGWLWPVKEDLVLAEAGVLAYGLEYQIATETT